MGKMLPCPGVPRWSSSGGCCPHSSAGRQMGMKSGVKLLLQWALCKATFPLFRGAWIFLSSCYCQEQWGIAEQQQSLQWATIYWGNICPWPQICKDRCDPAGSQGGLISLLFLPFHLTPLDSSTSEWYGPCAVSSIPLWCHHSLYSILELLKSHPVIVSRREKRLTLHAPVFSSELHAPVFKPHVLYPALL